ncbi:MAG: hypothetical protein GY847_14730 [Proteobacteria bacterium]|nr:hypothetical protein [Pseudomonadota bacterium]
MALLIVIISIFFYSIGCHEKYDIDDTRKHGSVNLETGDAALRQLDKGHVSKARARVEPILPNRKISLHNEYSTNQYQTYHHPGYKFGPDSLRWFIGEYSYYNELGDQEISVPHKGDTISGSDLGSSVYLNGRTFFYLGDTFWPGRVECHRSRFDPQAMQAVACAPNACCNDAIVISADDDPTNGIDVGIPLHKTDTNQTAFLPLIIPGIHDNPSFLGQFWQLNRDPNFTTTGGSGLITGLVNQPGPTVLLWYTIANWPQRTIDRVRHPYRAPRSFVVSSKDGFRFKSLVTEKDGTPSPFSLDRENAPAKFLCTSPVEITADQMSLYCNGTAKSTDKQSILCKLEDEERAQGGILVFGSGRNYRLSPLYLAYVSHAHLAKGGGWHIRYLGKNSTGEWIWKHREDEAYPIIGSSYIENQNYLDSCVNWTGFWRCAATIRDLAWTGAVDEATGLFGEVSVKLILDVPKGSEPTLVMLSNHHYSPTNIKKGDLFENINNLKTYLRQGEVYYRTASLSAPHEWSRVPKPIGVTGYGPYIIDRHTRYDKELGKLHLWYVLSLWRGQPMSDFKKRTQYGIATANVSVPWPPSEEQ